MTSTSRPSRTSSSGAAPVRTRPTTESASTCGQRFAKPNLVLDNLIHGYFILGHPERLDYDYEHIYAYITHRIAKSKAKAGMPEVC